MKIILINLDISTAPNIYNALRESDQDGWIIVGFTRQEKISIGQPFDLTIQLLPQVMILTSIQSNSVLYRQEKGNLKNAIAFLHEVYPNLKTTVIVSSQKDKEMADSNSLPYLTMEQFVDAYSREIPSTSNKMLKLSA
jgi:hypothetical protein